MENLFATLRMTILKISIFWLIFSETRSLAIFRIFRQKRQKALVFRSLNRFLIQIFLLDRKYFVVYEDIKFLVMDAHYCSLLVIFSHFHTIFRSIVVRKWCDTN